MNISPKQGMKSNLNLLDLFLSSKSLQQSLEPLRKGAGRAVLPKSSVASLPVLWSAVFSELDCTMLIVVPRPEDATAAVETISLYAPDDALAVEWPAYDFLSYERGSVQAETASARLRILDLLLRARSGGPPLLVIASVKAISEPTLAPNDYAVHRIEIRNGYRVNLISLVRSLADMGYGAEALVETSGTFSRRGDILDIWSPAHELPIRIELFGDEVDSIRQFDPESQRSDRNMEVVTICPPVELPLWESQDAVEAIRQLDFGTLRPEVRSEWEQMLLDLQEGSLRPTYGGLAPYFPNGMSTIVDHLSKDALIAMTDMDRLRLVSESLQAQAEEIRSELESIGEIPTELRKPYISWKDVTSKLERFAALSANEEESGEALLAVAPNFAGNMDRLTTRLHIWLRDRYRIVLVTGQAERTRHLLQEHDIPLALSNGRAQPPQGAITIRGGRLRDGWVSDELKTVVLGDSELWGYVPPSRKPVPRRYTRQTLVSDLQPGGFVVHIDHGIARYVGNVSRGPAGAEREYLILEYASGDTLYVPADQVDRVTPYIGAGGAPALSRLGTADWARTKRRVRKAAEDLARELINLYAARELAKGYSYSPDGQLQHEFEDAFPYVETEDQLLAIQEVREDMESPRPMDRLVCGDVGYGKTEVALRAAFKAVSDSRQVAVLVPTTVLALQHYETFKQRLSAFPVRVEMLSRLRPKKERDAALEGLRTGAVDIVIGTHMLLGKNVEFHDLGLLIIDEEQRFGVKHKEYLKQKRTEVDVLTLTATPIPRTLQMALAGVRDLSVIETPPEDRLPIKTYVTAKNDTLVRESVLREIDRGGQVYYVHNRVQDIARVSRQLSETVPEARVTVGHGQMEPNQLENVMLSFINHDNDLLLCTTIIESGLDIPNVNTLIVDDAANFGLSQLYQLRGRIGRGARRAYAYLMYKPNGAMSEDAQKRLDAIAQASELGAGFRIAMKDLEIRGAGNFLGPEQSGHVAAVGLELYTRLLERAVTEQRTGVPQPEPPAVPIDLPLEASLPADYIPDTESRIRIYRRIANMGSERDVRAIEDELRDRFGPLPEPARNLVQIINLKLLARDAGVAGIALMEGDIVLRTDSPPSLQTGRWRGKVRLVPGQVRLKFQGPQDRWMADLRSLLIEMGDNSASDHVDSGTGIPAASAR